MERQVLNSIYSNVDLYVGAEDYMELQLDYSMNEDGGNEIRRGDSLFQVFFYDDEFHIIQWDETHSVYADVCYISKSSISGEWYPVDPELEDDPSLIEAPVEIIYALCKCSNETWDKDARKWYESEHKPIPGREIRSTHDFYEAMY